jgi:hypothetical protein
MTRSMMPTPCLPHLLMRNAPRQFDEMPVQNAMTEHSVSSTSVLLSTKDVTYLLPSFSSDYRY